MFPWRHCSLALIMILLQVQNELDQLLWAGWASRHHGEHSCRGKMCSKFQTTDLQMTRRMVFTYKTWIIYTIVFMYNCTSLARVTLMHMHAFHTKRVAVTRYTHTHTPSLCVSVCAKFLKDHNGIRYWGIILKRQGSMKTPNVSMPTKTPPHLPLGD